VFNNFISISASKNLLELILPIVETGIPAVASCGIILNVLGFILLFIERKRENMFNLLLSALYMFDTFFLCFTLIKSIASNYDVIPDEYLSLYSSLVYPGTRFSLMASIFMTVALSHSRLRAVSKPIQNRNLLKSKINRIKYLLQYIIPILIFSTILTIPCFWEYEIIHDVNATKRAILVPSSFRQNPYYSAFYIGVLDLGFLGMAPFVLLVYTTIKISKGTRNNSITKSVISLPDSKRREIKIFNQKRNRALTVNLIAVIFLIFHSLRQGLTIAEFVLQTHALNKDTGIYELGCNVPIWLNLLTSISELLLVLNSSVNTIIYQGVKGFYSSSSKTIQRCCSSTTKSSQGRQHLNRIDEKTIATELRKPSMDVNKHEKYFPRKIFQKPDSPQENEIMDVNVLENIL